MIYLLLHASIGMNSIMKMKITQLKSFQGYFLLLFLLLATSNTGYGQGFVIDTTDFFQFEDTLGIGPAMFDYDQVFEDEIIELEENAIGGGDAEDEQENNFVPADIIFVPADVKNNGRWDTLYIRTSRTDFSKLEEPKHILLNNPAEGKFCFPFKGKLISPYGPRGRRFHAGTDIKLEAGDTIKSAFTGKVRIARIMSGYGKLIVIRHNNGLETVYGHLSKMLVKVNQEIKAGDPIGLGGRTGRATTTHLHFETRYLGEHFNPNRIIDFDNFCLKQDTLIIDKDFFGKKSVSVASTAKSVSETDKPAAAKSTSSKYHTVKSGDTLSAMAVRYKTTVSKICKLNGFTSGKKLKIGMRVRVK
jgi:murein DD-endopeptidase MepM/ murein hydrolase activator NlpD